MSILHLVACIMLALGGNEDRIESKQISLDSPIQQIYYCGSKQDTMLALTEENHIYRSETSGFSWKLITSISQSPLSIQKLIFSSSDSNLQAFLGDSTSYFSEDCGKTLHPLNYPRRVDNISFHPTLRTWALASSWTPCPAFSEASCGRSQILHLTKDLGKTWTELSDYIVQFSWGLTGLDPLLTKDFPAERIYASRHSKPQGSSDLTRWNYDIDLLRTDDFFRTTETLLPHGNKFLLAGRFILVAVAIEGNSEEVQLMISNEKDIEKFYRAELPVKTVPEHSYTLLDSSEGSVFLQVNHHGVMSKYGTIYVSDSSGRRFSESLAKNSRVRTGYCDFEKVNGVEGVYFANVYDREKPVNEGDKREKKDSLGLQKSVVSFDKGREWRSLQAPRVDSSGNPISCEEPCALHLHSVTSPYSSLLSKESAIGIVIGVGNIGSHLSYREDELRTYLSRDAGISWSEVKSGEFVYQTGDHGAIILMAESQRSTNELYYSWNEGLSWSTLLMDSPMQIEDIVIEPSSTSQKFLVYGQQESRGLTFAVDFAGYHEPLCRLPAEPGAENSDYEVWSPRLESGTCLMGRRVEYVRRRQSSECFNGEKFERLQFVENCVCTELDFECDVGYYRVGEGGRCEVGEDYEEDKGECGESQYVEKGTGYRRVAGNSCVGGVSGEMEPRVVVCPKSFGGSGYAIIAVVVVAIAVVAARAYQGVDGGIWWGKHVWMRWVRRESQAGRERKEDEKREMLNEDEAEDL